MRKYAGSISVAPLSVQRSGRGRGAKGPIGDSATAIPMQSDPPRREALKYMT